MIVYYYRRTDPMPMSYDSIPILYCRTVPVPQPDNTIMASEAAAVELRDRELRDCRMIFIAGFFGLPWLWFVNWYQYRASSPPQSDPMVQVYARRSLAGSMVGLVSFLSYFVMAQLTWRSWATGMMVNAPPDEADF
mmetsp:Transcript_2278/g.5756  ORF Transcript_2278/g.5756 Transcript_2278/m.5756 type:complete len:136 (+) Transcript_2278:28-435(+)